MWATKGGHTKIVQTLLDARADVNAQKHGWTALMIASNQGHTKIAQALLAAGADANAHVEDGMTALILASRNGHPKIVTDLSSTLGPMSILKAGMARQP